MEMFKKSVVKENQYSLPQDENYRCLRFLDHNEQVCISDKGPGTKDKIDQDSRIRRENRERKKKWRMLNVEKNKNIDLRCRVNKRASKLFGPHSSPEKTAWVNQEIKKRQLKRIEKEKVKIFNNPASSSPSPHHPHIYRESRMVLMNSSASMKLNYSNSSTDSNCNSNCCFCCEYLVEDPADSNLNFDSIAKYRKPQHSGSCSKEGIYEGTTRVYRSSSSHSSHNQKSYKNIKDDIKMEQSINTFDCNIHYKRGLNNRQKLQGFNNRVTLPSIWSIIPPSIMKRVGSKLL
ncbi:hypothetical protein AYI68_g137 [Smittium mucronatum]|uniref:DUF3020 domain-containing protein n=1 Tax=Smittium mucronatum TaxID=133383 RepID=A0A1R0H926_9FUNG|nr:hypothetical protein AYI68_g137 [Smittium mucronatum]